MRQTKEVKIIVDVLSEHKAEGIEVVDVKQRTPFADFYVLATAPNAKALSGYPDDLEEALSKAKFEIRKVEGLSESGWVIVDCGSVVVQIFTAEKRAEIGLDQLLAPKAPKKK